MAPVAEGVGPGAQAQGRKLRETAEAPTRPHQDPNVISDRCSLDVPAGSDPVVGAGACLACSLGHVLRDVRGYGVIIRTGKLYLNNTGDSITLRDAGGAVLATAQYGSAANADVSVTRATALDATAAFVKHTSLSTLEASPGRKTDGTPY